MSYKTIKLTMANTPTISYYPYSLYKLSRETLSAVTPTSATYFTFDGNELTGFKGGVTDIVIPSSYSLGEPTVTQSDGILINYIDLFHFGMCLGSMYSSATFKDPITEYSRTFYGEDLSMRLEEMFPDGAYLEGITFYSSEEASYILPQTLEQINAYPITVNGVTYNDVYEFENAIFENMLTDFSFSGAQTIYPIIDGDDYTVNVIGENVFYENTDITSVVIPESVTHIKGWAFSRCTGLIEITIPSSITTIDEYSFQLCDNLTKVNISSLSSWCNIDFKTMGNPLYYAHNLYLNGIPVIDLHIPKTAIRIGNLAFQNCTSITNVTMADSVTSIGRSAFQGCTGLMNITINEGVTSLGNNVFNGCTSLINVTIPNSVMEIANNAFQNCTSLTNIMLPNNLTRITQYLFSGCSNLTSVTIPNSVTYVYNTAFSGCSNLQYNEYDNGYYLGNSTNMYAVLMKPKDTSIESLIINVNTKVIASRAFLSCKKLTSITIPDEVVSINEYAFSSCEGLTDVALGSGVIDINIHAFSGCSKITNLNIPAKVTNISYGAFNDCSGLMSITVDDDNDFYEDKNSNSIIEKSTNTLIIGCKNSVIPSGVTGINMYAFYGCTGLTSITIPDTVTSIGIYAFNGCTELTSIAINEGVTSLGHSAFRGCTGLSIANLKMTSSSYKPSSYSVAWFYNCSSTLVLHIPSSVTNPNTAYGYYWNYYANGKTLTYYADL